MTEEPAMPLFVAELRALVRVGLALQRGGLKQRCSLTRTSAARGAQINDRYGGAVIVEVRPLRERLHCGAAPQYPPVRFPLQSSRQSMRLPMSAIGNARGLVERPKRGAKRTSRSSSRLRTKRECGFLLFCGEPAIRAFRYIIPRHPQH